MAAGISPGIGTVALVGGTTITSGIGVATGISETAIMTVGGDTVIADSR
jgi:hypothetical protein